MLLTDKETRFLTTRAKLARIWPPVGGGLLCLILGAGAWLLLFRPMLANPFVVVASLGANAVPVSTLTVMAGMLPLVVLMCVTLVIAIVLFCFASFANEKKYQAIIRRLT